MAEGSRDRSRSRNAGSEADGRRHRVKDLPPEVQSRLEKIAQRLEGAKVVAILRAKHEARAVERAVELAELGFKAIEVTCDSAGFKEGRLLPAVVAALQGKCLVGVGTVLSPAELDLAKQGGADFALSPVRPTVGFGEAGFVGLCHEKGILAMPAAFTPQEIYECVEVCGALTVKVFPSQLWTPNALKDVRRVGEFGSYRLFPSGGIDASTCEVWLASGASGVGMGGSLVGRDVATDPQDSAALTAAEEEWRSKGRPGAAALAKKLGLSI